MNHGGILMIESLLLQLLKRAPPPKSFSALVAWVRSVTGTTEAFYLLGDFILLSNPSATLMLVSQSILAAYHAASLANKVLTDSHMSAPKFNRMYAKLGKTQQQALLYMGLCDIGALLQLIVSFLLMSGKLRLATNIFVYLNLLKGRYHGTESASYHHSAWELIGNKVHPYIGALGPLRAVLDRIEGWFCTPRTS